MSEERRSHWGETRGRICVCPREKWKSQGRNILESLALCDMIPSCVITMSPDPGMSITYQKLPLASYCTSSLTIPQSPQTQHAQNERSSSCICCFPVHHGARAAPSTPLPESNLSPGLCLLHISSICSILCIPVDATFV